MTIHFHGGPIWGGEGDELIKALYRGGGALVSFHRPDQIKRIVQLDCDLILDNGAFSVWMKSNRKGEIVDWDKHWNKYYKWVESLYARIGWFIVPDVIGGTDEENDALLAKLPEHLLSKAVPVWHSEGSLERLERLCERFERVAIGCVGRHRSIRSPAWRERMDEVFKHIYITKKYPVKIHGLRALDVRAISQYPFDSADSAYVSIIVPKTKLRSPEISDKLHRAAIFRAAIEKVKPPTIEEWITKYEQDSTINT